MIVNRGYIGGKFNYIILVWVKVDCDVCDVLS